MIKGEGQTNFIGDSEIGSIGIKITSEEWYSKKVGLIKINDTNHVMKKMLKSYWQRLKHKRFLLLDNS